MKTRRIANTNTEAVFLTLFVFAFVFLIVATIELYNRGAAQDKLKQQACTNTVVTLPEFRVK